MFVVSIHAVGVGVFRFGAKGMLTTVWRAVFDGVILLSLAPSLGHAKLCVAVAVGMSALGDGVNHEYFALITGMT